MVRSTVSYFGIFGKVLIHARMPKTIFSPAQARFVKALRGAREKAGFTQEQLAKELNKPQSFVSKIESGERRLDLVELHGVCKALGISLTKFVQNYEKE
jgi:ribosome-binding protein aMBF1 (putative translation factor)